MVNGIATALKNVFISPKVKKHKQFIADRLKEMEIENKKIDEETTIELRGYKDFFKKTKATLDTEGDWMVNKECK